MKKQAKDLILTSLSLERVVSKYKNVEQISHQKSCPIYRNAASRFSYSIVDDLESALWIKQ